MILGMCKIVCLLLHYFAWFILRVYVYVSWWVWSVLFVDVCLTNTLEPFSGRGQVLGTCQCGLHAKFIDAEQMSVQQLIAVKRTLYTTHNGHPHK